MYEKYLREETVKEIANKEADIQAHAINYVLEFFSEINPAEIEAELKKCFSLEQIYKVVDSVPNWNKDIQERIEIRLLKPINRYSRDELQEMYPSWMASYANKAFQSQEDRDEAIERKMKHQARQDCMSVDQLREINNLSLNEAIKKLPTY